MHGQKKRRKRSLTGKIEIEGQNLCWELVSEPQSTTDGRVGLRISVRLAQGAHRELIIEYPYDATVFLPQRPKITAAIVESDTLDAIAEGWEPTSRGRAFVFMARTALVSGQKSPGASRWFAA